MPTFYNYIENGVVYSFDDVFVPADAFRKGTLFAWGRNDWGQIGDGTTTQRNTPTQVSVGSTNWKQVSAGETHTAAVKTDGTIFAWGRNDFGQLGLNNQNSIIIPTPISGGGTNWKQVSANGNHTAAIKTDGTLWTWGLNNAGQLGLSNLNSPIIIPTQVSGGGANWKQVSAGETHTAAVKTDGTLWAWGNNNLGQIGDGTTTQRNTPTQVSVGSTNWKQVSAGGTPPGGSHTAAVKTDGTLWTWGVNNLGQLGNGTQGLGSNPNPIQVGTSTNWKQVSAGGSHTTAVKTDGTLWAWGRNTEGQGGIGSGVQSTNPTQVFGGGTNWKQVDAGAFHSAAVKTDGTIWAWGYNFFGELGDNTTIQKNTPVQISVGTTNWKQVSCGYGHTTAITYIDDYI